MIFTNPLGLIALISLPVILGLHFFRDRRRVIRVGGLHLWDLSRTSLPLGRKYHRLLRSLSLLFQLLAALLLSLMIAGLDIPDEAAVRHYTIILDDSISMSARDSSGRTAAHRVVTKLTEWAGSKDRYTLIAAGARPFVFSGPFARKEEMVEALSRWTPESVVSNLEGAANLASKFSGGSMRLLLFTDSEGPIQQYPDLFIIDAAGKAEPNFAIASADRIRVGPDKDRILVTVKSHSTAPTVIILSGSAGERDILKKELSLAPGQALPLEFETELLDQTIRLQIEDDALLADNTARLAPVVTKTVKVLLDDFGSDLKASFEKAIESVPYARVGGDPKTASMVITRDPLRYGSATALRTYILADAPSTGTMKVGQGREFFCDRTSPLTADLPLEGVLWPYTSDETTTPAAPPLISHAGQPLFFLFLENSHGSRTYMLKLLRDKTNLFRQPAWPLLVQAMIEDCRLALPGPTRSNFRTGEEVILNLQSGESAKSKFFRLLRDGQKISEFEELPAALQGLASGAYEVVDAENQKLTSFNVNVAAPAESDLSRLTTKAADLNTLAAEDVGRRERNQILYYALLLSAILFGAGSWYLSDSSR